MSIHTYGISASDENELELVKWIELGVNSKYFVARSREMAVDCLRIFKLRFPNAEDPVNEASKDDTFDRVLESRARIFGAVSKEKVKNLLGH